MTDLHPARYESGQGPSDVDWPPVPSDSSQPAWAEEESTFDFREVVALLLRYRWLIIAAAILGIGAAYWVYGRFQDSYVARGSIWVQVQGDGGAQGPIQPGGLLPSQSWLELMQSFALLEPVVREQQLYFSTADPDDMVVFGDVELTGAIRSGRYVMSRSEDGSTVRIEDELGQVFEAPVGRPLGAALGVSFTPDLASVPADTEVPFFLVSLRDAASNLRGGILPRIDDRGSFITIEFADRDPERAAAVVNDVMERLQELATELKNRSLNEEYVILEEQLETAETRLAQAERELESFRVQAITLPTENTSPIQAGIEITRGPVFDEFFSNSIRLEEIRQDKSRLEEIASQIETAGVQIEALELVPSATQSSQIQTAIADYAAARAERRTLLERYTTDHPLVQAVDRRIGELEGRTFPAYISQLVQQLQIEEDLLGSRVASSEANLQAIPARSIEEARLRRRVALAEEFYSDVQRRFQVANLARASSIPDVRILDPAVPPDVPANDNGRIGTAGLVFLGFLGLGIGTAIVLGRIDSRLRTPDQVSAAFGLTILGAVPRIERGNGKRNSENIQNVGQIYEAFRGIRTNLIYAYGSAGPIVLTVSSPSPSEGKTTITTNLGIAFAELGRRTLLIDADTRRGDMHHYLDGRRKPGLTDYLSRSASADDVLQRTAHEGLDFIGSGTQVANSPELLSSTEMGRMMASLRSQYDVILVDSPPLGAGADPLVLATITGHLLLVVRSGSTDREFTFAKLEPLNRLPVRPLGAVVNDYEPSRIGDGYQYYASYLPGYEAGAEESEARLAAAVSGSEDGGGEPKRF